MSGWAPRPMAVRVVLICLIGVVGLPRGAKNSEAYDVVISNGRVMDPETGLDAVRNLGITDGRIAAISASVLAGKETIEARGLIVAPGFIDLHEHAQEPRSYQFQAADGVTTSLELESGAEDVDRWYAERLGKTLINYGVSASYEAARVGAMQRVTAASSSSDDAHRPASPAEIGATLSKLEAGLHQGALAIGMELEDTPGASSEEVLQVFRLAAKHHSPVHVHVRYFGGSKPKTGRAAIEEVIAAAVATGAPLHIVHITSIGLRATKELLRMIEDAATRMDITTECYPYTASSTGLDGPIFDPGWQETMGITYHDIQWAATGERLTAETFEKYRKQGGDVVVFVIPEEATRLAVSDKDVIIASDGMPITGSKIHPRGQGTFARVLGHYVRDEKILGLMPALRKMTLMPAQRLEKRAPLFKNKGRIRVGADADITIFNPSSVIDKATFEEPLQYSKGIPFVLVNGIAVVRNGQLVEGTFPGQAARAPVTQ